MEEKLVPVEFRYKSGRSRIVPVEESKIQELESNILKVVSIEGFSAGPVLTIYQAISGQTLIINLREIEEIVIQRDPTKE